MITSAISIGSIATIYVVIFTAFDVLVRYCGHKRFPMTPKRASEILRKVKPV